MKGSVLLGSALVAAVVWSGALAAFPDTIDRSASASDPAVRRTAPWTGAIFPGLVRHDEVAAGEIRHAIRVTMSRTQGGYILPATHSASNSTEPDLPPMGLRLRLRGDTDPSGLTDQALVIARTMQRYGVIVTDNRSNWFFQGVHDPGWDDDDLDRLKDIPGTAFEVVDTGRVIT